MKRLLAALVGLFAFLGSRPIEAQRGRPLILLVHGRGLQDRDSAAMRKQWLDALRSGSTTVTRAPLFEEGDVRVVWYADVLDPRSANGCDYTANDLRARRDAKTDADLKQILGFAGGFINLISALADDSTAKEIRALSADASFLGDVRKRCASEARLGEAIDRAQKEGRPVILVAHSLGALVAYDYLSARTDTAVVQELITIGSLAGASDLRRLVIGGDSTEVFSVPSSVRQWTNIRNEKDGLALPLTIGRDIVTNPPPDEIDPHEMVGYLRGTATAHEILSAWCSAMPGNRPRGCIEVLAK
jgi:pimeloyl-ACP methyl ester carboxylesterase